MKGAKRQCLHRPSSPPARTWQAIRYHDTRRHQHHNSLARLAMNRALQRCSWWYPCTTMHAPSHWYKHQHTKLLLHACITDHLGGTVILCSDHDSVWPIA